MSTMRALRSIGNEKAEVQSNVPIPKLRPDYVIVKTAAVALNPTDWMHIEFVNIATTLGCDFAGTVVEIGSAVTRDLKVGDRVFGFSHGGNITQPEDGAFGEYVVAKGDLLIKIPESMSFEAASTMAVGVFTNAQGVYEFMGLPMEGIVKTNGDGKKPYFLVYGGSTATGVHTIQFAKQLGFEVIAIASPRNFDFLQDLGADHVFDYSSPTVGKDINQLTENQLLYAFDTISQGASPAICAAALASGPVGGQKPKYHTILIVKDFPRPVEEVAHTFGLAYSVEGVYYEYNGTPWEADPAEFEFAKSFVPVAEKRIAEGKIKPHRYEVRGGLNDILSGLEDLKNKKVSGTKLVYRIDS